ncbi:hypothetical protein AVEN_184722-1, partial [Araneus ventricosus]
MSRVKRIKKKKGSKKTLKVPRQQYVPPQRHQQDETEAEPNKKKGSKKTQEVPQQHYVPPQRHQQDETEAEPNVCQTFKCNRGSQRLDVGNEDGQSRIKCCRRASTMVAGR